MQASLSEGGIILATPVNFSPSALDFGGVFPGSDGPDITVDPSLGPPAISFAGGVKIDPVPSDALLTAKILGDTSQFKLRDVIVMEWQLKEVDCSELPGGCHHGPPPKAKVLEIVAESNGSTPIQVRKDQVVLIRVAYAALHTGGTFKSTLSINGELSHSTSSENGLAQDSRVRRKGHRSD
jgi:hypothetical protein